MLFPLVLCFPAGRRRVQRCSGHNAGTKWSVLGWGGPSLPVLSPPSASQTEYIPLRVSGKSLTVTDERETIQQSLNRYQGHLLPCPCPGAAEMGLRLGLPPLSHSSQCLTGKYVSLRCTSKELAGTWMGVGSFFTGLGALFPLLCTGLGKQGIFQQIFWVIEN